MEQPKHIDMHTPDGTELNLEALYQIAPSCFTEALGDDGELHRVIDFNKLRLLLGDNAVDDAPEVYDFTWVGKRAALKEAAAPITKTLRPCPEESVNWDTTQNLYIEGDNLEVLKLLQNSYMGKVKMIYIDPPYNTGNDFIYHDNFTMSNEEYDENNLDEEGNRFRKNTDSNGRFHSDWCSMIYARLLTARSLLRNDGVIFIHIDDNEIDNLKKICGEIFGSTNYINIISVKTKVGGVSGSSEGKSIKDSTEYIMIYAKDKDSLLFNEVFIKTKLFERIKDYQEKGKSWKYTSVVAELTDKVLLKNDEKRNMKFYGYKTLRTESISAFAKEKGISEEEVYNLYADKIFQTTNAQSSVRQTVINETTDYVFPMFGLEYEPIKGKSEGKTIEILYKGEQRRMMMFLSDSVDKIGSEYYYLDKLTTLWDDIDYNNLTKEGDIEFPNGKKPIKLLQRIIKLSTHSDSIILDFFSGSSSTAHAVLQENLENDKNLKFIMVQLPEETPTDSEAYKAGYKNICEIGKERIRRAGKKILEEQKKKQAEEGLFAGASTPSTGSGADNLDIGFRVFKCEDSNYKEVALAPKDYDQSQLEAFVDNIKDDRTDLDLLFDCMLRWGVELSLPLATTTVDGCTIHNVNNGDLVACFDGKVTEAVIEAIAQCSPVRVVFRDSSFTEAAQKMNLFELFKQHCDWTDEEVRNNVRVI